MTLGGKVTAPKFIPENDRYPVLTSEVGRLTEVMPEYAKGA